ncbi:helix-turn-helix transcriptional regulator [Belliella kenyensis]|uniref:Helix-turn-helix transcriptional regulator n=1 Tax=Belliella kenyensis TaxID=1472724 RepID=A0ABV8EKT7_9BACT|nr:hypothetical protein [Belliella kenyensis]MCH7403730.1 hypothetical protein [Belliella kenyensis]MDN3602481.1 hypothetical protein [Belliella kenyensis]
MQKYFNVIIFAVLQIFSCANKSSAFTERQAFMLESLEEFKRTGNYERGLKWMETFIEFAPSNNLSKNDVIFGKIEIVNLLRIIENYEVSTQLIHEVENELRNTDQLFLKSRLYQSAARLYNQLGLIDLAILSNLRAIEYAIQDTNSQIKSNQLGQLYSSQAIYHAKQNDLTKAILYCYKASAYGEPTKELPVYLEYYQNTQGSKDSVAFYYNKLETQLQVQNQPISTKFWLTLAAGKYHLREGNRDKAFIFLKDAYVISENLNRVYLKVEILNLLALYYKEIQDQNQELKVLSDLIKLKNNHFIGKSNFMMIDQYEEAVIDNNATKSQVYVVLLIVFVIFASALIYMRLRKVKKRVHKINSEVRILEEEKENLERKVLDSFNDVLEAAKINDPAFLAKFKEVHSEFWKALESLDADLTQEEYKLCAFLYLNFTTKDIANFTFVQSKTVQMKKYRLRKKLDIETNADLTAWLKNLKDN